MRTDKKRHRWFPISMSDAAFFNEILSHVALHVYNLRHGFSREVDCPQSMILHSRAVNSVRTRLDDPILGTSDGIIGTVLAFACFSVSIFVGFSRSSLTTVR